MDGRPWAVLIQIALLAWGAAARAATFEPLTLDRLIDRSTVIVAATCVDVRASRTTDGRVVTRARLRIDRTVKGRPDAEIVVRAPGGVIRVPGREDGLAMMSVVRGAPRFFHGQRSVLFLWRSLDGEEADYEVVGLERGKIDVDLDGTVTLDLPRATEPETVTLDLEALLHRIGTRVHGG